MRFFVPGPLLADTDLALPPGAARHAQVRRVQPGDGLWLFDGHGCDWPAQVLRVGRSSVDVRVGQPQPMATELPLAVHLAVGMPANERMDTLVEKATELGVASVQPLLCERGVLRLSGERAERKREHWQAVAEAACEQCGRARVPAVAAVQTLPAWLAQLPPVSARAPALRLLLSLRADARALARLSLPEALGGRAEPSAGPANAAAPSAGPGHTATASAGVLALSGPEGGLTPAEEDAARAAGFVPVNLGPRTLRADTAPLALLAWFSLAHNGPAAG